MKKTFVFLLSTLFLISTADICLARGGGHGGRPPENGQSRGMRSANARAHGGQRSVTRQSATAADSESGGKTDSLKGQSGDKGQSGGFGGRHGMNPPPPPPPPTDEDGNPLSPPDEDGDFEE